MKKNGVLSITVKTERQKYEFNRETLERLRVRKKDLVEV